MRQEGQNAQPARAVRDSQDSFILEWGRMSSSWGINRTMAQIHALLFVTGCPLTMDDIIERLQISRGNASMSLRNLMDWGVVRRFRKPGARRDTYLSDTDAVSMVARVIRERKRRELDPTVDVLEACLNSLPRASQDQAVSLFRERVEGLLGVFHTIDAAFRFGMANDDRLRWIVENRDEIRRMLDQIAPRTSAKS